MRASKLRRSTLFTLHITTILVCLSLPSLTQTPTPAPTPAPPKPAGNTMSDIYRGMIDRVGDLIPQLQTEIEGPLMPWLEKMSWTLAMVVIMFGFTRLWRENSGASVDVFWWFGRVGLIFALMGAGPTIISKLDAIGHELAWGGSSRNGDSVVLNRFYTNQRNGFEEGYRRFTKGLFTVEPTGEKLKPRPNGEAAVVGVINDLTSSPKDINKKFENLSRNMPLLFTVLSFARGILAFGDLWLLSLGGFLVIAVRLAAPIMIALAIDRNLAQRITYPFIWGVIILTLVWPIVSQVIRALAYMGGNLAMSLDRSDNVYQWNPEMMQEILVGGDPYHTVILAILIMAIAGLSLWMSPVIAYKLASGQIYESVSSTLSGWMGAIVGAGVELYSATAAASITRQAEQMQAQGNYAGEVTRAEAGKDAGKLQIQARQGKELSQLFAQRDQQKALAKAHERYGNASTRAQVEQAKAIAGANFNRDVRENQINSKMQNDQNNAQLEGENLNILGSAMSRGMQNPIVAALLSEGIQLHGADVKSSMMGEAIWEASWNRKENFENYFKAFGKAQDDYVNAMTGEKGANSQLAKDHINAANKYANQTAGGINNAAALEQRANMITYRGSINAAGQVRDASIDAARLRAVAAVVSSVGHNIARDMEQGMTLRY